MYGCILRIIFFFLMSTNSFFFFFNLLPPWGGCPSSRACGAYPKARHGHLGGERKLKGMTFLWQSLRIFASSKFDSMDIVKVFFFF